MEGISHNRWERRERILKGEIPRMSADTDFWVPSSLKEFPTFAFSFVSPIKILSFSVLQKTLLNSLTFPGSFLFIQQRKRTCPPRHDSQSSSAEAVLAPVASQAHG
jgi:hypothetical protein